MKFKNIDSLEKMIDALKTYLTNEQVEEYLSVLNKMSKDLEGCKKEGLDVLVNSELDYTSDFFITLECEKNKGNITADLETVKLVEYCSRSWEHYTGVEYLYIPDSVIPLKFTGYYKDVYIYFWEGVQLEYRISLVNHLLMIFEKAKEGF